MVQVKGNSIHFIKKYIIENYGDDFFNKIIKDTDNDVHEILSSAILSSEMYDLKVKSQLCDVFLKNVSKEEFMKCSENEVHEQLRGLIRFVVVHISTNFIVNHLQNIWDKHFTGGKIVGNMDDKGTIDVVISEFESSDAFMLHIETYVKTLFEIATESKYNSTSTKNKDGTYHFIYKND